VQLCSFSDCLRVIAAVFARSQFFQQFKAYTCAQQDTSGVGNGSNVGSVYSTKTGQVTACECNRAPNMRDSQQLMSHSCTPHLSSVRLPPYLSDSTTDDDVALDEAATSNNDTSLVTKAETVEAGTLKLRKTASQQKKTRQKSASKVKPDSSWRETRKSKASLSDNKVDETLKAGNNNLAGISHSFCYLSSSF